MPEIFICESDEQIQSCYEVMAQLRPHLAQDEFVGVVRRLQQDQGYMLVGLSDKGVVKAALGIRVGESLAWGKYVYIDDLVTDSNLRSSGFGQALFNWAENFAKEQNYPELHLDSGVQRHDAHRFYLRERMDIVFYHFKKLIK